MHTFGEIWSAMPKDRRSDHHKALAGLVALGASSPKTAITSSALNEKLKLHLRKASPKNLGVALTRAERHITKAKNEKGELVWSANATGIKALEELTGLRLQSAEAMTIRFEDIHPEIKDACEKLFRDGHYPEAIGRAAKMLNYLIRQKTGRDSDNGTKMMHEVFSPRENGAKRLIVSSELKEEWQIDQQSGMEFIMAGVQKGIANVDKHGILSVRDEKDAFEQIVMISMLAKKISAAKLVLPVTVKENTKTSLSKESP